MTMIILTDENVIRTIQIRYTSICNWCRFFKNFSPIKTFSERKRKEKRKKKGERNENVIYVILKRKNDGKF